MSKEFNNHSLSKLIAEILNVDIDTAHELHNGWRIKKLQELPQKYWGNGQWRIIGRKARALQELTTRLSSIVNEPPKQITCSRDIHAVIGPTLNSLEIEQFWVILLDRSNKILDKVMISSGGVAGTVVDKKVVFQKALQQLASSIILAHNHPSGNLRPSQADLDLTKKLKAAGKVMDIQVLDHIIVGQGTVGYTSFADEELL